ncbi:MAG: hypothetical protein FWF75_04480, partial [Propionibacteriaceae bacterium]|nr:hypothetical protein [Propionibacteriaceae bacterium]
MFTSRLARFFAPSSAQASVPPRRALDVAHDTPPPGAGRRTRPGLRRRPLAAFGAFAILIAGLSGAQLLLNQAAEAAPGSPNNPTPGNAIFTEDFQNTGSTPIPLTSYTGSEDAHQMTYGADTAWLPGYHRCNGWIMNSTSPTPEPTADIGCIDVNGDAWPYLRVMAKVLGQAQGQSEAQAATNNVLSEFTNLKGETDQPAGTMLKMTSDTIPAIGGHYYAV